MNSRACAIISLVMLLSANLMAKGKQYIIDHTKTYFAIVTGKEGLASGAAHEHVVVAKKYEAKLDVNEQNPAKSTFNLVIPTHKLSIDAPGDQKAVFKILKRLKLRQEPFKAVDAKDLKEVRKSMLSQEQLDVEHFKKISLKTTKITKIKASNNYKVEFEMKIKKKTVTKSIEVTASGNKGLLKINGYTKIKFSEFGIKRYTAFLGAVKVSDEFLLVLDLTAKRGP